MRYACLVPLVLAFVVNVGHAQARDAVLEEERKVQAPVCDSDPECAAVFKRVEQQQIREMARAEAAFDAKPAWQKLMGWLAIPGACWLLWCWVGRKPSAQTDETNHTGTP